jgi:pimeloyl-ACP methyl ester carboxylesterase
LDYYVEQFETSGFRGPLNWYRNIDRNIEITPQLESAKLEPPAFFIAGKKDVVLAFADGGLLAAMEPYVPGLRGKVLLEGAGHWIQVERPAEVNQALLSFLKTISS